MQFQGKRMIQTQENGEKPHFRSDLGPSEPNSGDQTFFSKIWLGQSQDVMVSYIMHNIKKKLICVSDCGLPTKLLDTEKHARNTHKN